MRERALTLWAAGLKAGEVAEACGITTAYAKVVVCLARAAGDPRAHRRSPGRRPAVRVAV
ncbi:hypothetical protein D9Y22_12375 [Methylorubrum sp. DB1722]|nr:hypothetical protein [Methylorubrum sp. DB1722]